MQILVKEDGSVDENFVINMKNIKIPDIDTYDRRYRQVIFR